MGTAAQHEAVLHASPADLARQLAPIIAATLDADGIVVAALDAVHQEALQSALGDTAGAVEFADPVEVHSVPGFTVAVRWARTARRLTKPGSRALVVDQYLDGLDRGPEHWARLDIALNVALPGLPVTVLCPYPRDSPELARVRATHPSICAPGGSRANSGYRQPDDAVIDFPPPPPPELGPPAALMAFATGALAPLRHLVGAVATAAGLGPERVADLVLAANEIASNSVEHGPGSGVLRLWDTGGKLVAEIADTGGPMNVPFPGIALPPPGGARGRGMWLASELCDVLEVWSDSDATVIRMHVDGGS